MSRPSDVPAGAFLKTGFNGRVTAREPMWAEPMWAGLLPLTAVSMPSLRGGPAPIAPHSSSRVITSERSESFQVTFRVSRPLKYMASLSLMSFRMVTRLRYWLPSTPWVSS